MGLKSLHGFEVYNPGGRWLLAMLPRWGFSAETYLFYFLFSLSPSSRGDLEDGGGGWNNEKKERLERFRPNMSGKQDPFGT